MHCYHSNKKGSVSGLCRSDRQTDWGADRQTDRQQGDTANWRGRRFCAWKEQLTICGLHDVGLVVVAAGNASHWGHLGPLHMMWGALRQARHVWRRQVVICGEWVCGVKRSGLLSAVVVMRKPIPRDSKGRPWRLWGSIQRLSVSYRSAFLKRKKHLLRGLHLTFVDTCMSRSFESKYLVKDYQLVTRYMIVSPIFVSD